MLTNDERAALLETADTGQLGRIDQILMEPTATPKVVRVREIARTLGMNPRAVSCHIARGEMRLTPVYLDGDSGGRPIGYTQRSVLNLYRKMGVFQ